MLKVFLGGEGNNDIGTRWYRPMGGLPGVIEVLLRKVRATGWHVAGARSWQSIRKYRAGGALGKANHGDARNVLGLVLHAYEDACEMLAFVRDHDGDDLREQEIDELLDAVNRQGQIRIREEKVANEGAEDRGRNRRPKTAGPSGDKNGQIIEAETEMFAKIWVEPNWSLHARAICGDVGQYCFTPTHSIGAASQAGDPALGGRCPFKLLVQEADLPIFIDGQPRIDREWRWPARTPQPARNSRLPSQARRR